MPAEKATAIVLSVVEFSESSSVVVLFTREFGKLHAMAKGARRPKGPFESALDLLAQCRIVFLRKSSGALDLLTEAKLDDAAVETLADLAAGGDAARRMLRFELQALRLLGHLPSLEQCVECGAAAPSEGRVAFGLLAGGVLCARCREGQRNVVSISSEARAVLVRFALRDNSWQDYEVPPRVRGEVRGVVNHYLAHLLGHKPKMHTHLGTLLN
jgi:DNA repair protein RecO (recombination protein O)